jgi:VWFA-related protein
VNSLAARERSQDSLFTLRRMSLTGRVNVDDCNTQSLAANLHGNDWFARTGAGPGSQLVREGWSESMPRIIRFFAVANLVLLLAELAGAQAQNLPDAGTFQLNSRLVYIDIVARDRSGQIIHGLTQQDFKIEEDGRQQKVDFFAAHSFDPAIFTAEKQPPAAMPQLQYTNVAKRGAVAGAINIILFDLLNTPRSDLLYARKQLLEFLKKLPPGQSVALFVLTDTLHMVQNFTGSSDRLLAAAQAINPSDMSFVRSKSEAQQDDDYIAYFAQAIGRDPGGSTGKFKSSEGNQEAIRQDNRGYITVAALAELARATRGYPGRKNLLWLSEDFPVSVGAQITDERFRRGTPDLAQARETANLIADSQISVYPISLLGLEESGIPSSSSGMGSVSPMTGMGGAIRDQFNARQDLRYATNDLADQTGGEAFVGTNDFAGALRRSMLDGANYYTIAYRPSNDKWNGQFRKIHVELVGKSGSLDYRHGYFADPDTHASSDSVRDLHIAMQPATPESTMLALSSRVRLPTAQHPALSVDSVLDPSNAGFTTTPDGKHHAQFLVLLVALNDGEQQVAAPPQSSGLLKLDLTQDQYQIAITSGVPLHQELTLKPGKYRLRLGVSDMSTHNLGTVDMPVDLSATSTASH